MFITITAVPSTSLKGVGYNEHSEVLRVQFPNGSLFDYSGVTQEDYTALMESPSIGKAYAKDIKGVFESRKVCGFCYGTVEVKGVYCGGAECKADDTITDREQIAPGDYHYHANQAPLPKDPLE